MFRKLRERTRARRALRAASSPSNLPSDTSNSNSNQLPQSSHSPRPSQHFDTSPPNNLNANDAPIQTTPDTSSPQIARSPSLPHSSSSNPTPPVNIIETGRSRTDMGTRADTSLPQSNDKSDSNSPQPATIAAPTTQPLTDVNISTTSTAANSTPFASTQDSPAPATTPVVVPHHHLLTTPMSDAVELPHVDTVDVGQVNMPMRHVPASTNVVTEHLPTPAATNLTSIPNAVADGHDRYRRLSLDGELPPSAIRPDDGRGDNENDDLDEIQSEDMFEVDTTALLPAVVDVSACSKAGWEPMRGPIPNVPSTPTVEVRKENQDAYCVFVPFIPVADALPALHQNGHGTTIAVKPPPQMFLGVFDGHGAEGRPIAHHTRDFISVVCRDAAAQLESESMQPLAQHHSSAPPSAPHNKHPLFRPSSPPFNSHQVIHRTDPKIHRARLDTLRAAFSRAERALTESDCGIDHVFSGTTAVVSWLFGRELYTAWTGDSRGVIGRVIPTGSGSFVMSGHSHNSNDRTQTTSQQPSLLQGYQGRVKFRAVELSYDQKPSRGDEKRRVRAAGGRIARWQRNMGPLRVWLPRDWTPGLAMTRSIGDTVLSEYGVCPVPEVSYTTVGPTDSFLILASDGVWEFMTSQEVVDFVGKARREGYSAQDASERLVSEAIRRWRRNEVVVDDTTAVVMYMRWDDVDHGGGGSVGGSVDGISGGSIGVAGHGMNVSHGGSEHGSDRKSGEALFAKSRSILSRTRAKVSLRGSPAGVYLVSDSGHLTDFVCKNDSFQGV